jgi:chorismate dehydratase
MRTEEQKGTGAAGGRTEGLDQSTIRIGHFEFLNGYPLYYGLERGAGWGCFRLVGGVPTDLNRKLLAGELDISPVSSIECGVHADELLFFPHVSITADGAVDSIRLVSRRPMAEVESVALTRQSATSVVLLKILLRQRHGIEPVYTPMDGSVAEALKTNDAVLLIGDQALEAYYGAGKATVTAGTEAEAAGTGLFSYDLGLEWKGFTGLPMVFALWAVRRSFFQRRPGETVEVQDRLGYSIAYCAENRDEVVRAAADVYPFSPGQLRSYFSKLRYDLTDEYRRGLDGFYRRAVEIGEAATAPELEFIDG